MTRQCRNFVLTDQKISEAEHVVGVSLALVDKDIKMHIGETRRPKNSGFGLRLRYVGIQVQCSKFTIEKRYVQNQHPRP